MKRVSIFSQTENRRSAHTDCSFLSAHRSSRPPQLDFVSYEDGVDFLLVMKGKPLLKQYELLERQPFFMTRLGIAVTTSPYIGTLKRIISRIPHSTCRKEWRKSRKNESHPGWTIFSIFVTIEHTCLVITILSLLSFRLFPQFGRCLSGVLVGAAKSCLKNELYDAPQIKQAISIERFHAEYQCKREREQS